MQVDIAGRVNNLRLPITQPLIPLFECLVNCIEAIEDAGNVSGRIDVHLHRDTSQASLPSPELGGLHPIRTVDVVDNGIGFTDENFRAFFLADSTRKVSRGNKGIGRFSWLKFFQFASVHSTYLVNGEWYLREFKFRKTQDGVEEERVSEAQAKERKTRVSLHELSGEFDKAFPRSMETIAHKIIDHLLVYFVTGACPLIILHDEQNGESLDVSELFTQESPSKATDHTFDVGSQTFKAHFLKSFSSTTRRHTVAYCANKREVKAQNLSSIVPTLSSRLEDADGQHFFMAVYVTGAYLDGRVNTERTDIAFLEEQNLEFPNEITKGELDSAIAGEVNAYAAPYMDKLRAERRCAIEQFVAEKAPEYRFILADEYSDYLEKVPAYSSEEQIDIALYKVQREIEVVHRERATQIKQKKIQSVNDLATYKTLYQRFLEQENVLGQAALAKYVIHRRTILEFLDEALKQQEDGSYAKEDLVHSVIYPMGVTSDEVAFGKQNLWVVDERLAYHMFLASDRPLKKLKVVNSTSGDEPDVVIFNCPRAFAETRSPFQSIVIIELKRPERNDYREDEEDPVAQVLRYVKKLKAGEAKDKDGRTIAGVDHVPFYAYILCSLTSRIRAVAETHDFVATQDHLGYFRYHQQAGCYIEILSYEKMIDDAKKRNRVFFEKLNIPMT